MKSKRFSYSLKQYQVRCCGGISALRKTNSENKLFLTDNVDLIYIVIITRLQNMTE